MGIAITTMLLVVLAVWVIATSFWSKAVIESTAAVAALNAQSAYNRIRFAPGINDARNAVARQQAIRAGNNVINGSLTNAQADLMGLKVGDGCSVPTPAGAPAMTPTSEGAVVPTSYAGNRISRYVDVPETPGQDVVITVTLAVRWRPVMLPTALLNEPNSATACVAGAGVAVARKP